MCFTGANNKPCIFQRGFDGDRCIKPKHVQCPMEIDEPAQPKNSVERLSSEEENDD